MTSFAKILNFTISIIGLIFLHMLLSYALPLPWSYMNIIISFLTLHMLLKESGSVVWIAFTWYMLEELYAISPFGVILFSGTISILLLFWFYKYFFTNKSWYTSVALSFMAVSLNRVLYVSSLLIVNFFTKSSYIPWEFLARSYGWEAILTTSLTAAIYMIIARPFYQKSFSLQKKIAI